MSTITHKRRAIQRSIYWPAYRDQRAHMADLFGVIAYSGQPKHPLALGIKAHLIGRNTGLSEEEVCHFLRAYTFGPRYLSALKIGANRLGLDGTPCGYVTREEADYAALSLKAHYADREWYRLMRRELAKRPYPLHSVQPVLEVA